MLRFLFGFISSWTIAACLFFFVWIPHSWEKEEKEYQRAERYLTNLKEAELMLNDNSTSCEEIINDYEKRKGIPKKTSLPRYLFNEGVWMVSREGGYSPL